MRLDKYLAHTGFGSRKDVKKLAQQGRVFVNGEIAKRPETRVDEEKDEIRVDGEIILYTKYVYVMLNKPPGVISAVSDPDECVTVSDLVAEETGVDGLFPVGRLDKDATGLILLTNDGVFCHRATSPKKKVPKIYYVEVDGHLTDTDVQALKAGIEIGESVARIGQSYICREATLEIIETGERSKAHVTLTEGRFHQVKRMFQVLGKRVEVLRRVSFAGIKLPEDLEEGCVRELSEEEYKVIEHLMADE